MYKINPFPTRPAQKRGRLGWCLMHNMVALQKCPPQLQEVVTYVRGWSGISFNKAGSLLKTGGHLKDVVTKV